MLIECFGESEDLRISMVISKRTQPAFLSQKGQCSLSLQSRFASSHLTLSLHALASISLGAQCVSRREPSLPRRVKTAVRLLHPQGNGVETGCGVVMALFRLDLIGDLGPVAVGAWAKGWMRRLDMV